MQYSSKNPVSASTSRRAIDPLLSIALKETTNQRDRAFTPVPVASL
ncbi:MAG: hypothetical protein MUE44_31220 [Oscillatoriaceae cyanobacterium Prado104]|nr:hypothetical protein [Oscillatoriaceae cyanobacterium Prado104]